MKDLESRHLKAVKDQIEAQINAIVAKILIKNTNGAKWNGKRHTKVMVSWAIYFKCSFTIYGGIGNVLRPHIASSQYEKRYGCPH